MILQEALQKHRTLFDKTVGNVPQRVQEPAFATEPAPSEVKAPQIQAQVPRSFVPPSYVHEEEPVAQYRFAAPKQQAELEEGAAQMQERNLRISLRRQACLTPEEGI